MSLVSLEVPYFGRSQIVSSDDPFLLSLAGQLHAWLATLDTPPNDQNWIVLKDELIQLHYSITCSSNDALSLPQYRVDLLDSVIFPYLKSMKTRVLLDKERFQQLRVLISLVSKSSANKSDDIYIVLQKVDDIVHSINSKRMLFQSELATKLRKYLEVQWVPIINDHKRSLRRIGGGLIALGIVEVIGRPAAVLYPLATILKSVMKIVQELERDKYHISPTVVVDIVKGIIMLIVVSKAISILDAYTGLSILV
jgi:hypothetical protein